jgi:hypothetical protein
MPPQAIIVEPERPFHDPERRVRPGAAAGSAERFIVVSDAFHLPRAWVDLPRAWGSGD